MKATGTTPPVTVDPEPGAGEMNAREFEQLMDRLDSLSTRRGYSEKSRQAAHLVMVEGASISDAAEQTNLSFQAVRQLMVRIRRRMESMPSGWAQVQGWFPADVVRQLEELSVMLLEAQKSGKPLEKVHYNIVLKQD